MSRSIDTNERVSRRNLLRAATTIAVSVGLAGCSSQGRSSPTQSDENDGSGTDTRAPSDLGEDKNAEQEGQTTTTPSISNSELIQQRINRHNTTQWIEIRVSDFAGLPEYSEEAAFETPVLFGDLDDLLNYISSNVIQGRSEVESVIFTVSDETGGGADDRVDAVRAIPISSAWDYETQLQKLSTMGNRFIEDAIETFFRDHVTGYKEVSENPPFPEDLLEYASS